MADAQKPARDIERVQCDRRRDVAVRICLHLPGVDEALLLKLQLSKPSQPNQRSLDVINAALNNAFTDEYLLGLDSTIWSKPDLRHDLVSVNDLERVDGVSLWSAQALLKILNKLCGSVSAVEGIVHVKQETLTRPSFILSTMLSSLLPVLAIVVLYLVHNMARRLAVLAGFSALFSVGMVTLTSAKRGEIFAATST